MYGIRNFYALTMQLTNFKYQTDKNCSSDFQFDSYLSELRQNEPFNPFNVSKCKFTDDRTLSMFRPDTVPVGISLDNRRYDIRKGLYNLDLKYVPAMTLLSHVLIDGIKTDIRIFYPIQERCDYIDFYRLLFHDAMCNGD